MAKTLNQPRGGRARPKHIPRRTCVVCRDKNAKRELTRIVRQPEGTVALDPTGKQNGRGAYVCDDPSCWERVVRGNMLARALKTDIDADVLERLKAEALHRKVVASEH